MKTPGLSKGHRNGLKTQNKEQHNPVQGYQVVSPVSTKRPCGELIGDDWIQPFEW